MARPSKLTDAQWEKIGKRLLAGESASSLAREFGVSKASVSARFSERVKNVKDAANQIVAAEAALSKLNVSEQLAARSLADDLKAISEHLAGAARFGAATAHRLSGIAHSEVSKIDDGSPLEPDSLESLKGIAVLTKLANAASEIPLGLLKANKEMVDDLNKGDQDDMHWTLEVVPANAR
jgi:hypothetical protein